VSAADDTPEAGTIVLDAPAAAGRGQRLDLVIALAGIGLLVMLVGEVGGATLVAHLRVVGWGIALVVGQEILAHVANTYGWWAAFPQPRVPVAFRHLLAARIAGDAVNYVTPTATVGGELVRVRLLRRHAPTGDVAASVAVAKLSQTVGQAGFVVLGVALVLGTLPMPRAVRLGLVVGATGWAAFVGALIVIQRRGMFGPLVRLGEQLGWGGRLGALRERLLHLDRQVAGVHGAANGAFAVSSAWFLVGWVLGILDVYVMLWLLRLPASVWLATVIEVLSVALDAALFFVPAKIGTQEGGKVLVFSLLGLDPAAGLALGVLRRIRELAWAGVGLALLSHRHLPWRRPARAVESQPRP
jgi:uncharacterized membrane protein YbhN (UPF0104 family)